MKRKYFLNIFIIVLSVFFVNGFTYSDESQDFEEIVPVEESIKSIRNFEMMLNSDISPTFREAQNLFAMASSLEYFFRECDCMKKVYGTSCPEYDDNSESLFFKYLRSPTEPIFNKNDSIRKAKIIIHVSANVMEYKNKKSNYYRMIESHIVINGKREVKCSFLCPRVYAIMEAEGKIINVYFNNKGVCDLFGGKLCHHLDDYR